MCETRPSLPRESYCRRPGRRRVSLANPFLYRNFRCATRGRKRLVTGALKELRRVFTALQFWPFPLGGLGVARLFGINGIRDKSFPDYSPADYRLRLLIKGTSIPMITRRKRHSTRESEWNSAEEPRIGIRKTVDRRILPNPREDDSSRRRVAIMRDTLWMSPRGFILPRIAFVHGSFSFPLPLAE